MRLRLALLVAGLMSVAAWCGPQGRARLDPSRWGSDHVQKRLPDFMSGDQCLFCHRKKIADSWPANRHRLTIRNWDSDSKLASRLRASLPAGIHQKIDFRLGDRQRVYFLRRSKKYGQLDLLSASWDRKTNQLRHHRPLDWNTGRFAKDCAGCHSAGVASRTLRFSAESIECFSCHGDIKLDHTKNGKLAHLSPRGKTPPREIASTCGQCHLRGGVSRSTNRPYPNQFVPGDNLFRDFRFDFSDSALKKLRPDDRHIAENIRDIVINGKQTVTCLSCHDVHSGSTEKHQTLTAANLCWNCHHRDQPRARIKSYRKSSKTCGY